MIKDTELRVLKEIFAWLSGVVLLSTLAQIYVVLPWTPIPITGQTLGVSLVALSWGRKRASVILSSYFLLGFAGLPIFAMGKSGFALGPGMGYMAGMLLTSYVVGALADRGATKSFGRTLFATYLGSLITLGMGVVGLSFFLPADQLLVAGVLPFLPGDLIKNLISATASWRMRAHL